MLKNIFKIFRKHAPVKPKEATIYPKVILWLLLGF